MKRTTFSAILIIAAVVAVLGGRAISAQETNTHCKFRVGSRSLSSKDTKAGR
jgi:hypothetical protein